MSLPRAVPVLIAVVLILVGAWRVIQGNRTPAAGDCISIDQAGVRLVACDSTEADYRLLRSDTANSPIGTACAEGERSLGIGDSRDPFPARFCAQRLSPEPTPKPGPASAVIQFSGETIAFNGHCTISEHSVRFESGHFQDAQYLEVRVSLTGPSPGTEAGVSMTYDGTSTSALRLDGALASDRRSGQFSGLTELRGQTVGAPMDAAFECGPAASP